MLDRNRKPLGEGLSILSGELLLRDGLLFDLGLQGHAVVEDVKPLCLERVIRPHRGLSKVSSRAVQHLLGRLV
jgi:hypothetical protein